MKYLFLLSLIIAPTILSTPTIDEVMGYISSTINKKIKPKIIKVYSDDYYEHELIESVSKYLFEDIKIIENIAPLSNSNRPGDVHEKKYITVHDTGDFSYGAKQWSQVVYNEKIGNSKYDASYQYVVGNDGYYHNIPDNETAYHAGDGRTLDSLFREYPTGVNGNKAKPHISISSDGFYIIDEQKSKIKAPTDQEGNILKEKDINDLGIYTSIKDGEYYIGGTWYSDKFKRIGNYGGNLNSIGIESCINYNTDIYLTWQRLAKLVAKLMDENNLGIDSVVQHHYFSGKNCPQTMRTAGYWEHFLNLVKTEYQVLQYKKSGFSFELKPLTYVNVDKNGRVIGKDAALLTDAIYSIKVKDSKGNVIEKNFHSTIIT